MIEFEKNKDKEYNEWLDKNKEFLDRYVQNIIDKAVEKHAKTIAESFDKAIISYFESLDHKKWLQLNGNHLYVEVQDLIKQILNYHLYNNSSSQYRDRNYIYKVNTF